MSHVFPIFPTLCYRRTHPELEALNPALISLILNIEKAEEGRARNKSTKYSYHSQNDFFQRDHAAIAQLKKVILSDFSEYYNAFWHMETKEPVAEYQPFGVFLWGWSVVMREGSFNIPHVHPNANISGVYYVQTPSSSMLQETGTGDGWLAMKDPRTAAPIQALPGQTQHASVPPAPGSLIMFPSYIEHYVPPFRGEGERISIAFNIRVNKKQAA